MYAIAQSILLLGLLRKSMNDALLDTNLSKKEKELLKDLHESIIEWQQIMESGFPIEIKQLPSNIR